jgi:hypothetical protein
VAKVGILPFEGARGFRVGADVAYEFSCQIVDRSKNTASDDAGAPAGRTRFGFVSGQVIQNDVNFLTWFTA